MILQALNDYYHRKQSDHDPKRRLPGYGLEEKEIPFIIEIDAHGRFVNLNDTRSGDGNKLVGKRFLVPKGVKKTSGIVANLLWDTAEYVLGVDMDTDTRKKLKRVAEQRAAEQHAAFRARLDGLPEQVRQDAGVRAVIAFLASIPLNELQNLSQWQDIIKQNPLMSFRLQGDVELVCRRPAVVEACLVSQDDDDSTGVCLVTGNHVPIERLHPAIKGVWGAKTSGANIVSFNLDAFASYGKIQGANAPVGKDVAFAYTTALNHLLDKDSRQRIQIGDATTAFWAEKPHDLETLLPDLFGEPPKDDPDRGVDALRTLYLSVQSGKFSVGDPQASFYVLGLAPNAARIAVRFWKVAPAMELAGRIRQHFEDIRVARAPHDPECLSLFCLLIACAVQRKPDNIPPILGGDIMRAILEDMPYPISWLNAAVQRCRAERKVTYPRAAGIKACLNRAIRNANRTRIHKEGEFQAMLDTTNLNPAYRLGRLFATLEKIQEDASPGLNATIRDRYYASASSTPVAVLPTLLRLKNHHLAKLNPGRAVQMEKLLGEIMVGLTDFPPYLTLPDQGRFALGYYHQRQAFFTPSGAPLKSANNQEETQ